MKQRSVIFLKNEAAPLQPLEDFLLNTRHLFAAVDQSRVGGFGSRPHVKGSSTNGDTAKRVIIISYYYFLL